MLRELEEIFDSARIRGDVIFYPSTEEQVHLHGLCVTPLLDQ